MDNNTKIEQKPAEKKDYKETEKEILEFWQKNNIYKYDPKSTKPMFSIDTPPPTVSGKMHLGHAYAYVLPDFMARYKRKNGFNVFYPFGFDDNGIATELLVEKLSGVRAKDVGKSKFVELCVKHTKEAEQELQNDFQSLGLSCDWDLLYRTISPQVVKVAQYSFLDLHKKGKIYREKGPILWCTKCQTAISQAELVDIDKDTYFNDLIFKLEDGKDIIIATTRPEFLAACVAIFVHPEDKRYKDLVGKQAIVPIFNFKVKILADSRVSQDKGTGIVMCCTFGDQTDMEWYKQYKLELKEAITVDGHMSNICGKYSGMKIEEARKEIIEDLQKESLLVEQKKISHTVNCHERCNNPVEIIVASQWYIDYMNDKELFIKEAEKIKWNPSHMKVRYDNWIKNLQWNWCISRQRYSGVPFPIWFCKDCGKEIFADIKDLPIYPEENSPKQKCSCGSNEFVPETSIMDTWSISALTPLINLGWPDKDISNVFPMSMRPQGQDIITLWAFNTIVKSLYHTGKVPWNNLMINGYVLDPHGEKMSKSKGNVIGPQETLAKWGKDPFRYWCSQMTLGTDIVFSEKEMQAAQKLIIKIENSMKFVDMLLQNYDKLPEKVNEFNEVDKWILAKLNKVIKESTDDMENYDYSHTIQRIRDFFFMDFCDNYMEFIKYRVYGDDQKDKDAAAYTLFKVAYEIINMLSIFMPFVCEDVYLKYFKKHIYKDSINICDWPKVNSVNEKDLENGELFKNIIGAIRKYKSQNAMSMKVEIDNLKIMTNVDLSDKLKKEITKVMFVKNVEFIKGEEIKIVV